MENSMYQELVKKNYFFLLTSMVTMNWLHFEIQHFWIRHNCSQLNNINNSISENVKYSNKKNY